MLLTKEELDNNIDSIKKFAEQVLFKGIDVKHDIFVTEGVRNQNTYILFQIYVEVDKMYNGSPIYDSKYTTVIRELDYEIKNLGRYFNISYKQLEPYYVYIENSFVNKVCKKATHDWYLILMDYYKVRRDVLEDNEFTIHLMENPDYISDTQIMVWCNNIMQTADFQNGEFGDLSCKLLSEIASSVIEKNGIRQSGFPVSMEVCEGHFNL